MRRQQDNLTNRYMVLILVSLGTLMSAYVSSSVNLALPNMMQVFGFTIDSVVWVSLAYMIPYGATLPVMGKLGDLYGRKKMYLLGMAIFTVATLLVGLAWSDTVLIVFRILQGLGAGLLFPNAMAIVTVTFPANERGQALGIWGALAAGGSAFGPTLGGYIVEYLNWRLIFYSIMPISLTALLLGWLLLPESKNEDKSMRIDFIGGFFLVSSLSALLLALNKGAKEGWLSPFIVSLLALFMIGMILFVAVELCVKRPLVDLSLFKNPSFTMSNFVGFISFLAMYGALFLMPFFLRNILGYTAIKAGIAMLPLTASMVLLAPLGGKLGDRLGSRFPAALGMTLITLALFSFSRMTETIAGFNIVWRLCLMGVGLAFTMSPLSNGVMGSLPPDKIGVGSGIFNLFKNVGGSVGVALMGALLDQRQSLHKDILKDYISFAFPVIDHAYLSLYGLYAGHGVNDVEAQGLALKKMQELVVYKAAVLSYQDVFLATACIAAIGVLAALFIRDNKKAGKRAEKTVSTQNLCINCERVRYGNQ